jgi:protein-tyrosine-phosphatase
MKILFICKHNVFRSRVAEEYFNKINQNKGVTVMSRGLVMGGSSDSEQRSVARELLGVNIAKRGPLPLKKDELEETDKIIVVADDIPRVFFDYQIMTIQPKVEIWKIHDEQLKRKSNIKKTVLKIKKKVDGLDKR